MSITTSDIPQGLALQLLRKQFGNTSCSLDDLIFEKISYEILQKYLVNNDIDTEDSVRDIQTNIKKLEKQISQRVSFLRKWYNAYLQLAVQCAQCSFNEKGLYCGFYGQKRIPFPDPENPNKKCDSFIPLEDIPSKNVIN
jgi:hypothetical protein